MKTIVVGSLLIPLSVPCFAVEKSTQDLNGALGKWALDSVLAGMQNEELTSAIRVKARDILAKNGIRIPTLPKVEPEKPEQEPPAQERPVQDQADKKNGPPGWAPAKGWRRKFGTVEEEALGQHLSKKFSEGAHGDGVVAILRQQIDRVSKGLKVGDDPKPTDENENSSDKKREHQENSKARAKERNSTKILWTNRKRIRQARN